MSKVLDFLIVFSVGMVCFIGLMGVYNFYFGDNYFSGCGLKETNNVCFPNKTIVVPCEGRTSVEITCVVCEDVNGEIIVFK